MTVFPSGTEVRSPEISTLSQPRPANREKNTFLGVQMAPEHLVQAARTPMAQETAPEHFVKAAGPSRTQETFKTLDARATRDAQLRDH